MSHTPDPKSPKPGDRFDNQGTAHLVLKVDGHDLEYLW